MIPWWGWLALWSSLVIVLLIVLVLAGWLLFRKFMFVLDAFEELAETSAVLDNASFEAPRRAAVSILQPFAIIRHRRSSRLYHAKELRSQRRARRLTRARAIIAVDATTLQATVPRQR